MFHLFSKNTPIGIDISDYSIEVLQLNKRKEVLAHNRAILEEGIIQDGKILNKEKLAAKIKEVLENAKPNAPQSKNRKLKAILSLPESKTFIHYFELPRDLQGEALREKVLAESSKIIPLDQERIYWDYIAVSNKPRAFFSQKNADGELLSEKVRGQRVAYVGALKAIVDEYIEVTRLAGIETVAVDAESLSLSRALMPASRKPQAASSVMIIDIGARTSNVSIFNPDKLLALSITIPIAGNDFARAIAEHIKTLKHENIKTQEQDLLGKAERLKREYGFSADSHVLSILQASFQPIIKEIKEAISYYEKSGGEKIEEIILAGGSALLPKADEYLAANLERKVIIGDPLARLKSGQLADKQENPVLFANVIGLALRGAGDIKQGINLLPRGHESIKTLKHKNNGTIKHKNTRTIFVLLFFCSCVFLLGLVLYRYVYAPNIQQGDSGKPTANVKPITESEVPAVTSVENASLPEMEKNDIINSTSSPQVEEKIIIQDTPTGWLNVREGPGASYGRVAQVKPGEIYTLLEENNKWYKIKIPDNAAGENKETEGWISSQYAIKK